MPIEKRIVWPRLKVVKHTVKPSEGLGIIEEFTLVCGHFHIYVWSKGVSAYKDVGQHACWLCAKKGAA